MGIVTEDARVVNLIHVKYFKKYLSRKMPVQSTTIVVSFVHQSVLVNFSQSSQNGLISLLSFILNSMS